MPRFFRAGCSQRWISSKACRARDEVSIQGSSEDFNCTPSLAAISVVTVPPPPGHCCFLTLERRHAVLRSETRTAMHTPDPADQ